MKNYRNKSPPQIKNAFTDICKDIISDKRKGCGIYCEVTEDYILCPSCKTFVWHKSCLESLCKEFDMDFPDINTNKWKCPNCMWNWIFKIFNLNEFSKCFHLFIYLVQKEFFGMSSHIIFDIFHLFQKYFIGH